MKKLICACEESQAVTIAFRNLGFTAFSCDLQDCSGDKPEWHIKGDIFEVLSEIKFDMLIGFPPCTYLTNAQNNRIFSEGGFIKDYDRFKNMLAAKDFFTRLWSVDIPLIALENPVPCKQAGLPQYSQLLNPSYFGAAYSKRTCLWLKGLPPLFYSCFNPFTQSFVFTRSGSVARSKTFPELAYAMAAQWSDYLKE